MTLTELLQHLGLSKNGTLTSSNGNINIYIYINEENDDQH